MRNVIPTIAVTAAVLFLYWSAGIAVYAELLRPDRGVVATL